MSPITADGSVVELACEEGREMLDKRTRRMLGMSLEQFEAAYDAGTLPDRSEVLHLVMLLPLPGRTPHGALQSFLAPLQRAMSCITAAQLYVADGKRPGETLALGLSEDPLLLRTANGDRLQFLLAQQFRLVLMVWTLRCSRSAASALVSRSS